MVFLKLRFRFVLEDVSLQEERRRTGRYIAAGTAILLSLLGLYQALIAGTPEYAALLVPALIMFVYIVWILYASKHQRKQQEALERAALEDVITDTGPKPKRKPKCEIAASKHQLLKRSYSIA